MVNVFFGSEIVKLFLQDKRVDPSDRSNYTIRYASMDGHVEVVKLLKQHINKRRILSYGSVSKRTKFDKYLVNHIVGYLEYL